MTMSEFEIVKDYGEAKDKAGQIEILADLNMCGTEDILNILRKNGIPLPKSVTSKKPRQYRSPAAGRVEWTEENIDRLRVFVSDGLSLSEMAERLGTGITAISKQISKYGLRSKKKKASEQSIDDTYIKQVEGQLKDAKKEKKSILEEHKKAIADYTEIVVGLEEELAEEKERCQGLTAELHALFEDGPFEEIRRQAQNIKGLIVLGLCALGNPEAAEGIHAAFLNIADSADVILEEAAKKKAPDVGAPGAAVETA